MDSRIVPWNCNMHRVLYASFMRVIVTNLNILSVKNRKDTRYAKISETIS